MAKATVVTKKPKAWADQEVTTFEGIVYFPDTLKEALEMGYTEAFIMNASASNQTIRVQSVISAFVGKPKDWEDGHIPTKEEVQKHLDKYDFTSVSRKSVPLPEKVSKLAEGASKDSILEMIAKLEEKAKAMDIPAESAVEETEADNLISFA